MSDVFNFYVYDDRSIQFKLAEPILLEDKNVTEFRFRIPKSLNGFDMTDWEWWFIFVNPKGTKYTTLLELSDDVDEPDEYSVATYTVGYGFSGIVGTVKFSIEALYVEGESIINEWHTRTYSTTVTDTLQGHRAIIPEPDGQSSTGITEEVKQALLQIARKVAYIDEHGQTYYDALYNALYAVLSVKISPSSIMLNAIGNTRQLTATTVPAGANVTWVSSDTSVATVSDSGLVTSVAWGSATITATAGNKTATCSVMVAQASVVAITADYNQSGTIYTTASLDDLKSDLIVSAEWSDGTSSIVADTDYTLSGTLTAGTSTITVNYGGQSTIFNVTVTAPPTLQSITATYTQSGTVYDTASLDDLKSDLVVTANYSDSTSETVTGYTLSGTLAEGTSTITVSYAGLTTTFNVTVSVAGISFLTPATAWNTGSALTVTSSSTDGFSGTVTAKGWNAWRFGGSGSNPLFVPTSDVDGKTIHISFDCEITGYSSGDGIVMGFASWTGTNPTAGSSRSKSYDAIKETTSGHYEATVTVAESGIDIASNRYLGLYVYCNMDASATVSITNIVGEYY